MELIKIVGGLLIIVSGTFIGIYASERLKEKVSFFEQYIIFLTHVRTTVSYTSANIKELLTVNTSVPLVRPVLRDTLILLERGISLEEAWRGAVDIHVKDKEDKKLICYFGDNFGRSDVSGELNKLDLHCEFVKQRLDRLREELKTKQRLYRVIGMFCGVLTAVILI